MSPEVQKIMMNHKRLACALLVRRTYGHDVSFKTVQRLERQAVRPNKHGQVHLGWHCIRSSSHPLIGKHLHSYPVSFDPSVQHQQWMLHGQNTPPCLAMHKDYVILAVQDVAAVLQ